MKRPIPVILSVSGLLLLLFFLAHPLAAFIAGKQIEAVFPDSRVSISSCGFNPFSRLSLRGITIDRRDAYRIILKNLEIDYDLFGLMRAGIRRVVLSGLEFSVTTLQKNIAAFPGYLRLSGKSPFRIEKLQVDNAGLDIGSKDLSLKAKIFCGLDLKRGEIDYFYLDVASLDFQGLSVEELKFKVNQKLNPGSLSLKSLKFGSAKASQASGNLTLQGRSLSLDSLSADLFGGKISAYGKVGLDSDMAYSAAFKFSDLDLGQVEKDFKLQEKVEMSGKLKGNVLLEGKGAEARILAADFLTLEPGGTLVIKDTSFLKNVARTANQPLDIIVESFRDYHYNTGVMRALQKPEGLVFEAELEGEKGKRRLVVTLHDILPRREK